MTYAYDMTDGIILREGARLIDPTYVTQTRHSEQIIYEEKKSHVDKKKKTPRYSGNSRSRLGGKR